MPELSRFYGIIIRMYYGDHAPPHFHAVYQGEEIKVDINTLEVNEGEMSRRAQTLVIEWAIMHRGELRCRLMTRAAINALLPKLPLWSRINI